jgi:hypothetical protein
MTWTTPGKTAAGWEFRNENLQSVWEREDRAPQPHPNHRIYREVFLDLVNDRVIFQAYAVGPRSGDYPQRHVAYSASEWEEITAAVAAKRAAHRPAGAPAPTKAPKKKQAKR